MDTRDKRVLIVVGVNGDSAEKGRHTLLYGT